MPTPFVPHQDGEIIYAEHVNELQRAIQNSETRVVRVGDDLFTQKALLAFATLYDAEFMHVDTFEGTAFIDGLEGVALDPDDKCITLRPGVVSGVVTSSTLESADWGGVTSAHVIVDAAPGLGQVKVYASNDGGATWIPVGQDGVVAFSSADGRLKLKAELYRPSSAYESPRLLNWAIMWGALRA